MAEEVTIYDNSLRFAWHIPGRLAGSAMPGRYADLGLQLEQLRNEGIEVIVNLSDETLTLPDRYDEHFVVIHEPILDGEPPSFEQMHRIIDTVSGLIDSGKSCVVHCRGGIGRSATVLAPIMMRLCNCNLEQALNTLRGTGRHPETLQQSNFLKQWSLGSA